MNPYDITIRIAAIGLNRADLYITQGRYRKGAQPGIELSGTVVAMGSEARRFKLGDAVCALAEGGALGVTEITLSEALALSAPKGIRLEEAAALPEAMATCYFNLFLLGKLKPTDRLLVHGGTSGVGMMAIQMAKHIGAEVVATCGSAQKQELARQLGADQTLNYKTQQLSEAGEVDVILDTVGAPYLAQHISLLRYGGRLLIIGLIGGSKAELPMGEVLIKNLSIQASTFSSRTLEEKYSILEALREYWWPLVEKGQIRQVIDGEYSAADLPKALARMEHFAHTGKMLILPS